MTLVCGPLTGQDTFLFEGTYYPLALAVAITEIGAGFPLDMSEPARYIRLGWFALLDAFSGNPDIPDGHHLHPSMFIEFPLSIWYDHIGNDAATGIDGFRYSLNTGVEATFYFI